MSKEILRLHLEIMQDLINLEKLSKDEPKKSKKKERDNGTAEVEDRD